MSDREEKMNIPGHSPASKVAGMRVSKPHHPVSLSEEKSPRKLNRAPREFLETNSRALVLSKDNKLGVMTNGQLIEVKDAYPTAAVRSFHENKPCTMGKYPLSHSQPMPAFFQPKSFNEIARFPNR